MWSKSRKLPLDVAEQVADSQYQNDNVIPIHNRYQKVSNVCSILDQPNLPLVI